MTFLGCWSFNRCTSLTKIIFRGANPPSMEPDGVIFGGVTATVYYPAGSAKWDPGDGLLDPKENYGGHLTWVHYNP